MSCLQCEFFHSDSYSEGFWYICTHEKFGTDGEILPTKDDVTPEWCPLINNVENIEKNDSCPICGTWWRDKDSCDECGHIRRKQKNMSDLLRIAVEKWCDEVRAHDNWLWGNTCANLLRDIDYTATSKITRENIRVTLTDGKPVELLRLEHGWGIRWGKCAVVPIAKDGFENCSNDS